MTREALKVSERSKRTFAGKGTDSFKQMKVGVTCHPNVHEAGFSLKLADSQTCFFSS